MEKWIAEKLRAQAGDDAGECPEAEIIAAYLEHTLTPQEKSLCESHFDRCRRCQEQIAALVRLGDEEEPVARSAPSVQSVPAAAKAPRFRWAWAAPVLVAATVAGLWYTGEFRFLLKQVSEPNATVSRAKHPVAPQPEDKTIPLPLLTPAPGKKPGENPEPASAEPNTSAGGTVAAKPSAPEPAVEPSASRIVPENAGAVTPEAAVQPATQSSPSQAESEKSKAVTQAGNIAPTEALQSRKEQTSSGKEGTIAKLQSDNSVMTSTGSNTPNGISPQRAPQATSARAAAQRAAVTGAAPSSSSFDYVQAPAQVDSAGRLVAQPSRWRVGAHGLIQKEIAEGQWKTVPSGVQEDLLAIAFPVAQAGWIVGRSGVVLRSTDGGATWEHVTSPTSENLVYVAAQSAETAQVSTASGEVFSTTDGGKSWQASEAH